MKFRQTAVHLMLAFLLLLSQQLGMAHAILHLSSNAPAGAGYEKKQLPGEMQCDQCLAYASIGSLADTPSHSFFAAPAGHVLAVGPRAVKFLSFAIRAFDSRAPPAVR